MAYFRDRSDLELDALTDEEIVEHMVAARRHGHPEAERRGREVLAWRLGPVLESRIRLKLRGETDAVVEQIRGAAFESLLDADFKGESYGEVRSFANTIVDRRIADHYRRKRLDTTGLAEEHGDDEESYGAIVETEDETGWVETRMVHDEVLARRSPVHQRVINLWLQGQPSKDVARIVNAEYGDELDRPMTPANVDQIKRRFRDDVSGELGLGE